MSDEFYRIQRLPPYVFAEVDAGLDALGVRGAAISRSLSPQAYNR